MNDPLAKLIAKADSVAESASALVRQSIRDIQGEISVMSKELRLGVVAKDREKVEKMILRRMADLSVRLNELMETQNELAAKAAAKSAGRLTGMEVKYNARRAEQITALVTPKQGENLAAVFTDQMGAHAIGALRYATVKVMREQAVQGGGMKAMARALEREWLKQAHSSENFQFKDAGGHVWDTRTYMQMNVRTNAMRVYNDCLVDNIAQATGGDLARISTGGDPNCPLCSPWEGVIVSISGKTKGLPTYEQAREAGCFHPNCVHTLEYVDEIADEEEIELQKAHPVNTEEEATDPDAADERKYAIDQDRYRQAGMSAEEARVAVDRDNLAASIRHGMISDKAEQIVKSLTDTEVTRLCPQGNPPRFEPFKATKREIDDGARETWNKGSRGGIIYIKPSQLTADHLREVARLTETPKSAPRNAPKPKAATAKPKPSEKPMAAEIEEWQPQTELERNTKAFMDQIGAKHTTQPIPISEVNPEYELSRKAFGWMGTEEMRKAREELKRRGLRNDAFTSNCQRCVPTWEATKRGYKVKAMPYDAVTNGPDLSIGLNTVSMWKNTDRISFTNTGRKNFRANVEEQMKAWGDGARAEVRVVWKGAKSAHVFVAEQIGGKTVFMDPQSGRINYDPFADIATRGTYKDRHWILRTDTNEFTDVAKRCFTTSEAAQPSAKKTN